MHSRKLTIIVLFTIVLSAGAVFLAPAEAAKTRDSWARAGASLPEVFSIRALMESVLGFAHTLWAAKSSPPPQNPPPNPSPTRGEEGPGICPNGQPSGQHWTQCSHHSGSGYGGH
jgi:hypothetical protein